MLCLLLPLRPDSRRGGEGPGYSAEQQEYGQLAREIKAAIRKEFFTAAGRCAAATQTGLVLSLMYGLVPEGYEEKNRQALKSLLEGAEMH